MPTDHEHAPLRGLVERIHATPPRLVMEFAGAGALALWLLHSVAGSSRTILEASDRYVPASLSEAVGFVPTRFASPEVAAALARLALRRAMDLAGEGPVFGLGLTATIATDRTKRGEHRLELAVADAFGTSRLAIVLSKGARDRLGEERLVAEVVLRAVADASGILDSPLPELLSGEMITSELAADGAAAEFERGERRFLLLEPKGASGERLPEGAAILSGSFNPVHDGHWRLREAAQEKLGRPVVFELSLANADKPGIDLSQGRRRANQFLGRAPILLDRAPLFNEKARLWPGRTFVLGVDTAERMLDPRFYGSVASRDAALAELAELESSFLVAGRLREGGFVTLDSLAIPSVAEGMFTGLTEEEFREDLSSSQLREGWTAGPGGGGEGG